MKTKLILAALLALGLLAAGCTAKEEPQPSSALVGTAAPVGDESQPTRAGSEAAQDAASVAEQGSYTTLESLYGAVSREDMAAGGGSVYQLRWDEEMNVTLTACPTTGGEQRVLCEAPGCTHSGESCEAWFGNNQISHLFYVNDALLVVTEDWDNGTIKFTSIATDGTGRQALASLSANQLAYDFIALRGDSLYFVLHDGAESHVTQLDLNTGENGVVMTLQSSQTCIGTVGDRLALLTGGDGNSTLSLVDDKGASETILTYDWEKTESGFFDESFYLLHKDTGVVTKTDLASGVDTVLGEIPNLPPPDSGQYRFVALLGDTLVVDVKNMGDSVLQDETTRWLLNIHGRSEPVASTLTTGHTGEHSYSDPLQISMDTGEALLVVPAVQHGTQTLRGTDGDEYDAPSQTPEWALISHSDFLSGNPAFMQLSLE